MTLDDLTDRLIAVRQASLPKEARCVQRSRERTRWTRSIRCVELRREVGPSDPGDMGFHKEGHQSRGHFRWRRWEGGSENYAKDFGHLVVRNFGVGPKVCSLTWMGIVASLAPALDNARDVTDAPVATATPSTPELFTHLLMWARCILSTPATFLVSQIRILARLANRETHLRELNEDR